MAQSYRLDFRVNLHPVNKQNVYYRDLGLMEYGAAWDLQESLLARNVAVKTAAFRNESASLESPGETRHYLLLTEHPPVFTLGKSGKKEHVLINEEQRAEKQIAFFHTNRGGDITFHGPGQIVGYPILDLERFYTDIGKYLRNIEEVIIRTLDDYGIKGQRSTGETGVWLDPSNPAKARKICAIGVRSSRWVTMHGFALNVNTELDYFNHIIPCGISGKQVTSLARELGREVSLEEVKSQIQLQFEEVFDVSLVPCD
jgi:lipoyl(octanoyl) transferase